jgi:hypothetical protein
MRNSIEEIEHNINSSFAWLENNGWAGYDPYDIRSTSLYFCLNRNRFSSAGYKALSILFPQAIRQLFKVKLTINAKAVALLAHAYLDLYASTHDNYALEKAQKALTWLLENPCKGYHGLCWGYPFDWDTKTFIPANTPSVVVTSIACEAFFRAFELLNSIDNNTSSYSKAVYSCAEFVSHDLQRDNISSDMLCFSYTPIDLWHVHNANIFAALTLTRALKLSPNSEWEALSQYAVNYTLFEQRVDGAWPYWGSQDNGLFLIDHYHTGFILRSLDQINRYQQIPGLPKALEKGFSFYQKHLFTTGNLPKYSENSIYPIDIHGCAEAVLCLTQFSHHNVELLHQAQHIAYWIIHNMQAADGHFYYRKYPLLTIRFPFVRWAQAWMLRALAALHLATINSTQ